MRNRGFTLLELIALLPLLAVVAILSVELFNISLNASKQASRGTERISRLDSMLSTMRRDVWAASSAEALHNGVTLRVGEHDITWRSDGETIARITNADDIPREWQDPPPIAWSVRGSTVTLTVGEGNRSETIVLVSQLMRLRATTTGGAR